MEPWKLVVEAEREYFARRTALMRGADPVGQLRLALSSPDGVGPALRLMLDGPEEYCRTLVKPVFAVAISAKAEVPLARRVLRRLDRTWLEAALEPLVVEELDGVGVTDWEHRRIAELLVESDLGSLLGEVVDRAESADDDDIREVGDDFRRR